MNLKIKYMVLACFAVVLVNGFVSAKDRANDSEMQYLGDRFFGVPKLSCQKIVYVSNSNPGEANFTTIQSAIDYVPQNNREWICIYIKTGLYKEQVSIPAQKPYIFLLGESKRNTVVVWDAHESIATSPAFLSRADNIVAKSITFQNSYNNPETGLNPKRPAVAAYISGDKSAFYRCGFLGYQDTLWDVKGRHYFKFCTIQGAVDFIFGSGQSIYESCTISVIAGRLNTAGYITAQGRTSLTEINGFVFKNCNVIGHGIAYLGRPWREYATVIFYNSSLSAVVHPEGWDEWDNNFGNEDKITFAEENCFGAGSETSMRVKWEKRLSDEVLKWYVSILYINSEGWIQKQPFYM